MNEIIDISSHIPEEVLKVQKTIKNNGFESFLVGGCVRDLILGKKPKDWDITTNALPQQIQALFPETFCENEFGTVGVVSEGDADPTTKVIEVTTYRTEGPYSDARRPDSVSFSLNIGEDLERRDFTINAIAYDPIATVLHDPHKGQIDIKDKLIRAVGEADKRFSEDALRILRAIRLYAELDFVLEENTEKSIQNKAHLLSKISRERIRDEFVRIIMSNRPMNALLLCKKLAVLQYINEDLEKGVGVKQNQAHKYDVFEHNLRALQHAADKNYDLETRLGALFHDISKPEARRWSEEKKDWTFHGHEVVGAKKVKKILTNLKFPAKTIEKVSTLVRWHMFFSDPEKITLSAVRRMAVNVGKESIWDLMDLRVCDRIGTGRPKENPYRFRKYKSMVEEALRDPISVGMLKMDGSRIMEILKIQPGPKVGYILHILLEEVLDDPEKNNEIFLLNKVIELGKISEANLKKIGQESKEKKESENKKEIKKIRDKYFVE